MSGKSNKRDAPQAESPGTHAISEAEWAIMEILWESSPRPSSELCAILEKSRSWKRATIMTLLSRLIGKGVVVTSGEGRRWQYSAAVPRESCVAQATQGFLDRMFNGALLPMVAHCIEHQRLTPQELSDLRALLNQPKAKSPPSSNS